MIVPVTMYSAKCDICNESLELDEGWIATNEKNVLMDYAKEAEWAVLGDGQMYCPDCHTREWDEEGEHLFTYSNKVGKELLGEIEL